MGKIAHLPDPMQRQWRAYEQIVRRAIVDTGVAPDVADTALAAIKPVYMKHARQEWQDIAHGDGEAAVTAINEWVKKLGSGLLFEVLIREIELIGYRANEKGDRE